MIGGAFAGMQGYTPITALINIGGGVSSEMGDLAARIRKGGVSGAGWGFLTAGSPVGGLIASWVAGGDQDESKTAEEKDAIQAKLAMAAIGMIECYALTRPGTLATGAKLVGDLAVAAGEAVPL